MKRIVLEFLRRGFSVCGIGPIVLAVVYWIVQKTAAVNSLTVNQVCIGIISLTILAFVAGGMNAIYQVEQLPLMAAIFIHGAVLYVGYLAAYLVNDWLDWGKLPILVFTGIFVLGYLAIWAVIYAIIRHNTNTINEKLKNTQRDTT